MFGLEFLFAAALWALPLAGLPVLLHMLYRRKSPVIPFPTLRFIKASIQRTAARRKIQRWVLLACRILLLALLIFAVAQPFTSIATDWGNRSNLVAAVVVDTSYSMSLKEDQVRLLDRANDVVEQLVRADGPLGQAKVAVFTSRPADDGRPPALVSTVAVASELKKEPEPARVPLAQRISAAIQFLRAERADQKWLVVLSDLQAREFPSALPAFDEGRTVLFDLRPRKPRSYGVASVRVEPEQPIPGIGSTAVVEVTGPAGDARDVSLTISKLDGSPPAPVPLKTIGPLVATFDAGGRARLTVPLKEGLPAERFLLLTASVREDDLAFDNERSHLLELPPRRPVTLIDSPAHPQASLFLRLALDPWEGRSAGWPLELKRAADLTGQERAVVFPVSDWPDATRTARLLQVVRAGGTVILLLQPGLEQTWAALPAPRRQQLLQLLPSAPLAPTGGATAGSGQFVPSPPARPDPLVAPFADPSFRLGHLTVRRFVPFAPTTDRDVATLLHLARAAGDSRSAAYGLLFRRDAGNGVVYTLATLPESRYATPAAHPLFLPLLVSMALPTAGQREVQNVELGAPLTLAGASFDAHAALDVVTPDGKVHSRIAASTDPSGPRFTFPHTLWPGLYVWRNPADGAPVARAAVAYPAAESDPIYRPAAAVLPTGPDHPSHLVVTSYEDLVRKLATINQRKPHWPLPITIVLVLFCFEALLGSLSELWKPVSLRSFFSRKGA